MKHEGPGRNLLLQGFEKRALEVCIVENWQINILLPYYLVISGFQDGPRSKYVRSISVVPESVLFSLLLDIVIFLDLFWQSR